LTSFDSTPCGEILPLALWKKTDCKRSGKNSPLTLRTTFLQRAVTQFIHLNPRNFSESIEQCKISKNTTFTLTMEENSNKTEIPNSISTLTHLHTFKLIGIGQEVNVNSITSLHNQIQTCIIEKVQLTPNLNDKSNPIYTLTKLQHLELFGCKTNELNETISKLTSLQTLLLPWNFFVLNGLPSSMTKLTSLLHLSLNYTNIPK
jgi:hypothetical protein